MNLFAKITFSISMAQNRKLYELLFQIVYSTKPRLKYVNTFYT